MKKFLKWLLIISGSLLLLLILTISILWIKYYLVVSVAPGQLEVPVTPGQLGRWVNPFIGTGGIPWVCANNFPGAARPFGMVRLSPETVSMVIDAQALNTSGYYYPDSRMTGFSHTRLAGTGATDGGHFLVLPLEKPPEDGDPVEQIAFSFSHSDEQAFPGYYAVYLADPDVLVELTAGVRVGVHRYHFYSTDHPAILIQITHALGNKNSREGEVHLYPSRAGIEGSVRTFGSFASRYGGAKVYFSARFDRPYTSFGISRNGRISLNQVSDSSAPKSAEGDELSAYLSFSGLSAGKPLIFKLALSYVSIENARENLEEEAGGMSFDEVQAQAESEWERKLSKVRIETNDKKVKTIFYTALYHSFQMPTIFTDVDGRYKGFDRQIHHADDFSYYTDLSLWDTFRTVHPLFDLIDPEVQRDMLVSLVEMSKQGGGWLPRWPSGYGYTNSMLGTPADMVIAGSYLKGIDGFDVQAAYRSIRRTALEPTKKGDPYSGREGLAYYLRYRYCPAEVMKEAVSRTLEFAYADYSTALLAEALGYSDDADLFRAHAAYYKNLWNPETQYFQPRDTLGNFVEKFDPLMLTYMYGSDEYTNDYVEGSAMQWRWAVPFDPQGLIALFKSKDYFVDELNNFFALSDPDKGEWNPGSYYWHGNEPDLHAAYLFNDAGRPDLTQKWVRWILENKYDDTYDGLDGNDDAGTLSAWYVFSALGFYPVAGTDKYLIGSPLVEKAEIALGGTSLNIICDNYSPDNIYIRRIWLNDSLHNRYWISHKEIAGGGTLRFEMSALPLEK